MENSQSFKHATQPIVNWIKIRTAAMEPGKYIDITALAEQLNIYEDVMSPFIVGDISIVDGLSLITKMPFIGQERIAISYRSSFNEKTQILEFDVYRISPVSENADDKNQIYTLFFSSPEFIQNKKRKVSQSFEDQHDIIVNKIYDNYLKNTSYEFSNASGKPINIPEQCEDNDRIVFPNWNPLRCINWISGKARSKVNIKESSYLFFERMGEGFYFIPLTSLGSKQSQFKYFRASPQYATIQGEKDSILPILTIDSYVVENDHNIITAMNEGRYLSTLNYYDVMTREYGSNTYNINSDFNSSRHVEENYPTNERMTKEFSSPVSNISFVPYTSNRNDDIVDYSKDTLLLRNAQLSQFKSHCIRISVPGNSDLHCGDVVQIEIPLKDAPRDQRKGIDKSASGRYLVRSIRHRITRNNEYISYLTLVRDSIVVPYPEIQTIANLEEEESFVNES